MKSQNPLQIIDKGASPLTDFTGTDQKVDIKDVGLNQGQNKVVFYNQSPTRQIIGLDIFRVDNPGHYEDVITDASLILQPNEQNSIIVSGLENINYQYRARYGTAVNGKVTTEIIGTLTPFKGTAGKVYIPAPKEPTQKGNKNLLRLLVTLGKPSNDWEFSWADYDKCQPIGICTSFLRLDNQGNFAYFEPDANGKQTLITSGTYHLKAHEPMTQVITFSLSPNNNNAQFSEVHYHYAQDNLLGGMNMCMDVTTANYGKRTVCFGVY